jgi:hypothetical protein
LILGNARPQNESSKNYINDLRMTGEVTGVSVYLHNPKKLHCIKMRYDEQLYEFQEPFLEVLEL